MIAHAGKQLADLGDTILKRAWWYISILSKVRHGPFFGKWSWSNKGDRLLSFRNVMWKANKIIEENIVSDLILLGPPATACIYSLLSCVANSRRYFDVLRIEICQVYEVPTLNGMHRSSATPISSNPLIIIDDQASHYIITYD
jgi:hypothetical protein